MTVWRPCCTVLLAMVSARVATWKALRRCARCSRSTLPCRASSALPHTSHRAQINYEPFTPLRPHDG
eukprot:1270897-Prymnesium_polylepis.2